MNDEIVRAALLKHGHSEYSPPSDGELHVRGFKIHVDGHYTYVLFAKCDASEEEKEAALAAYVEVLTRENIPHQRGGRIGCDSIEILIPHPSRVPYLDKERYLLGE